MFFSHTYVGGMFGVFQPLQNYFHFQQSNELNKILLEKINEDGRIHMVPSLSKAVYFLRFAVCASNTELSDIQFAWTVVQDISSTVLLESKKEGIKQQEKLLKNSC